MVGGGARGVSHASMLGTFFLAPWLNRSTVQCVLFGAVQKLRWQLMGRRWLTKCKNISTQAYVVRGLRGGGVWGVDKNSQNSVYLAYERLLNLETNRSQRQSLVWTRFTPQMKFSLKFETMCLKGTTTRTWLSIRQFNLEAFERDWKFISTMINKVEHNSKKYCGQMVVS